MLQNAFDFLTRLFDPLARAEVQIGVIAIGALIVAGMALYAAVLALKTVNKRR